MARARKPKPKIIPSAPRLTSAKCDHVPILESVAIESIRPAKVNDKVYRPVDPKDPAIIGMAREIANPAIGLLTPIAISSDDVILSGHRRHAACRLAGLTHVTVQRFPILSTEPLFDVLLVAANRQREKSADEVFREELIRLNPADTRRRLNAERQKAAQVNVETMTITGKKTRAAITNVKKPFLDAIRKILDDLRDFLPVSDRTIHYQLLNNPPLRHASKLESRYVNDQKSYKALCELLTRARIVGLIPFDAIHDPTRPVVTWDVHAGVQQFISRELNGFLKGFHRDLQRTQPLHVEIIGEKNTIEGIIRPVAWDYSVPYTIGRGYSSLGPRHDIVKRFRKSGKEKLLLLFLSDSDPEGDDIAHSFTRSIRDDFGVSNVEAVKVALTREQAKELNLPPLTKAKAGSSRRKAFVKRHGSDFVWELEAVPPEQLQQILQMAIERVFDMNCYHAERQAEERDAERLEALRRTMRRYLVDNFDELSGDDDGTDEDEE